MYCRTMQTFTPPFSQINDNELRKTFTDNFQIPLSQFENKIFTPFFNDDVNDFDNDIDSGSQILSNPNDFTISNHFFVDEFKETLKK